MQVRQTKNDQKTITVETVEPTPETIVLKIVAESGGFYAVEYEDRGETVCGQFVDMEDRQELYRESEDDVFHGDEAEYRVMPNGSGFRWVECSS